MSIMHILPQSCRKEHSLLTIAALDLLFKQNRKKKIRGGVDFKSLAKNSPFNKHCGDDHDGYWGEKKGLDPYLLIPKQIPDEI